jgi:hypothetical protein
VVQDYVNIYLAAKGLGLPILLRAWYSCATHMGLLFNYCLTLQLFKATCSTHFTDDVSAKKIFPYMRQLINCTVQYIWRSNAAHFQSVITTTTIHNSNSYSYTIEFEHI